MANYNNDDDDNDGLSGDGFGPDDKTEHKVATVQRVIWENDGPRKILKMSNGETWLGAVGASVAVGDILEVAAQKGRSPRGDEQWAVEVTKHLPYSQKGLTTWLMDRLPDIGDKRAAQLAQSFPGELLFAVLRDDPQQLTVVAGITPERAEKIGAAYKIYAHEASTVIELVDLGIDYLRASRAVATLGVDGTKRVVRNNPFDFVDLPGWSFDYIQKWVLRQGNPYGMVFDDPRVVCAFARDVLEVLAVRGSRMFERDGGDCYLGPAQVGAIMAQGAGQGPFTRSGTRQGRYLPIEVLDLLRESRHLAVRNGALMLADLDEAERNVADTLIGRSKNAHVDLLEFPPQVRDGRSYGLDESQRMAASALVQLPVACMTGGPGTGKTTTLRTALDAMAEAGEVLALASFTGKAAKRMAQSTGRKATTIHRLLEWTPTGFRRNADNPIKADVVVIDEASMLDIRMASSLILALGEARLLLVGDSNQLPPVGPGQPFTDVLRAVRPDGTSVVPTYRLTKTHRQAGDNWVIDNAPKIINFSPQRPEAPSLDTVESPDGGFRFLEATTTQQIVAAVVRAYQHAQQHDYVQQLQVLCPMRKPDPRATAYTLNRAVQREINPQSVTSDKTMYVEGGHNEKGERYRIFESDKVIFIKNIKLGLSNGDTGQVLEVYSARKISESYVKIQFDGLADDEHPEGVYTLTSEHFQHIDLAYAITVHKSQGSEWPNVIVIADPAQSRMLKKQLLYTAVTRTSKNLWIIGTAGAVRTAIQSEMQNERWTRLTQRLLGGPV